MVHKSSVRLLGALAFSAIASVASASGIEKLYVGIQDLPTFLTGTYAGQPNPNHDRLTLLYAHLFPDAPGSNHFHRIGAYVLTGPAASPVVDVSSNNAIPEPYTSWRLRLMPGSGAFAGKQVSGIDDGSEAFEEYGDLRIRPTDQLTDDPPGTEGHALWTAPSSAPYRTKLLAGTTVAIELVDRSPELGISVNGDPTLLASPGQRVTLGNTVDWSFLPVFFADLGLPENMPLSATFRLVDVSNAPQFGTSGEFSFNFSTVPEPGAVGLLLVGGTLLARRRG